MGNRAELEEAVAIEIGMSFLKARRVASEVIADAERRAREFVMAPDLHATDEFGSVDRSESIGQVLAMRPAEFDLRSLAAQVDEIEGTLLSCHQRILGFLDSDASGDGAVSAAVAGSASPTDCRAPAADEDGSFSDEGPMVTGSAPTASLGEPPASGFDAVGSRAHDAPSDSVAATLPLRAAFSAASAEAELHPGPRPDPGPEPSPPRNVAPRPSSNGADSNTVAWGPPDPWSRVAVPAADAADELHLSPAGQPGILSDVAPGEEGGSTDRPAEDPMSPSRFGPDWWSAEEAGPERPTASSPEERATRPAGPYVSAAGPYVSAAGPAKTSSTLWLLNVIGCSVLLIVVVVVLMLANVL